MCSFDLAESLEVFLTVFDVYLSHLSLAARVACLIYRPQRERGVADPV